MPKHPGGASGPFLGSATAHPRSPRKAALRCLGQPSRTTGVNSPCPRPFASWVPDSRLKETGGAAFVDSPCGLCPFYSFDFIDF